jgi:glycine C-acetyltransferase
MLMSRAKRFVFRHNDMTQLAERLQQAEAYVAQSGGGILVITEGVFGMKGDLGNLPAIAELKQRYNFRLLVDDAHGFGVMGARGQGTGEHFGVHQAIDVLFCTFAKSMALIGAFVAADQRVIQYLRYNLRSQIYAKSLPYPIVAGALKRLALLRDGAERRHQLWSVARQLQEGLIERGFEIGPTQSPVTPVYMDGTAEEAGALTQDLRHTYGLFVSVVTYPVIERGKMILRMIPTANHTAEDVAATLAAFSAVAERKRQGYYAAAAADPA